MQGLGFATPADEPINLSRFCDLLQDHAQGSVQCNGADSVMLFGSTGVGKSTMLHLLAGANFSFETIELETSFGTVINRQLRTQMEISGCMIGHSATSTTQLLNSHHDSATGLSYIDTPGFNNVGGDDDTTIDAANSAAIMSTIRSCSTLRVVFLISVKDELNTTKAGQIKRLFELMGKFIMKAESHMQSVLMLFTHCAGFTAMDVMDMFKRIANALPKNLMPFLQRAVSLLNTHQDVLLIDPAAADAQQRMNQIRNLLKTTVVPIADTETALQCPLSNEVLMSLENVCRSEKEQIVLEFLNNGLLIDSRSHLDRLRLLHDALGQKELKSIYASAVDQVVSLAEDRKKGVLEYLQRQSFSQVRSSLSIWGYKYEVSILSSHMSIIGRSGDVLETLHNDCILSIMSTCEEYDHNLDEALAEDNFDAVVTVLRHCEGMLEHLKEYVPTRTQEMLSCGARNKVRVRTIRNKERALARIHDKKFDTELCFLLDTIRHSSDKFFGAELLSHDQPTENETGCLVEADYGVVSAEMNTMLTRIAEELKTKFKPDADVSTNIIIVTAFIEEESSTAADLALIDSAYDLCRPHIRDDAKEAREACHEALSVLKDTSFESLRDAIGNFEWKDASSLFDCMQRAGKLGSEQERRSVKSRLGGMKNLAISNLDKLLDSLSTDLARDDFQSFSGREISLGNAIRLPADSELGKALLLDRFRSARDDLLSQANHKFTQAALKCKTSLEGLDFADVMARIRMLDKMAEALSVGREPESGCPVPDFNKRIVELLQHVHSEAKCAVDKCKLLVAPLHDPLQDSTESKVENLAGQLQQVHQLMKHVFTLKSQIPSLCIIMSLNPSDVFPQSKDRYQHEQATAAAWDEELFRMLQEAHDDLCGSLQAYARACHDRCLSSLAAEPKPLADDIVNFLNTLIICQNLDQFLASAGPGEGAAGKQSFAEQRKSVRDAVKQKFTEVRDAFSRDVRADRLAAAQSNLEWANEMQPLRDEFAGDAITFDAALEEMRSCLEQKSGTFARKFDDALSQERFPELRTLLLGSRDLKGAAEQEEYSSALRRLIDAGDRKYTAAIQIINMISHDVRGRTGDFPPSVEQVATSLRWIESARCLSVGEYPILPAHVFEKWQSAFHNMTKKLELLKAGEAKLEEWKFATVEETYRRLRQLQGLLFPEEISETIGRMQSEVQVALEAKVAGLDTDVRNALEKGDHLLLDLIFQEVQIAKDAGIVSTVQYFSLLKVMEHFLNDLVESIKGHYMNFEIKEAYSKEQQLFSLKKANVVKPHVARTGLGALAKLKKSSMITAPWLSEGHVNIVKDKVKGFSDVDSGNYQMLVGKFMDSFEVRIKGLRKVNTKTDVIEVREVLLQIPRFAVVLDSEQSAFQKWWDDIWNSFFECVDKKWRLACTAAAGQEHDISDSISSIHFLQAARRLLMQNVTGQYPKAGRNTLPASFSEPKRTSRERVKRVTTHSRDVMSSEPVAGDKRSALDAPDTGDDDGCAEQDEGAGTASPKPEQAGMNKKLRRDEARNLSQQQEERKTGMPIIRQRECEEQAKRECEEQAGKADAWSTGFEGRVGHGSGKVGEKRRFRDARDTGWCESAEEGSRGEGGGAVGEKLKDKRQEENKHKQEGKRNGKDAGVNENAHAVIVTLGFVRGRMELANSEGDFVDAEEDFQETKCAFSLPFDDVQVKSLIEKLDNLLQHFEVDTAQIDADWIQNVEKFDFKTEARSFVETLKFIRKLKLKAQAISTCGEYGCGNPTPTLDRAVKKLFASVEEQVKSLDAWRPEECAVVLQNLVQFGKDCNRVVDDDCELQQQIFNNIKTFLHEAWEWVEKVTKDFAEQSTEKYRQAQLEHSPEKRKALLCEVTNVMERHQRLEEKLVERGLKQNNGTDSPLVAQIKLEISGKAERTRQGLTHSNCTVEDVAGSIHEIYVAATDLDSAVVFKHSECCIASILQDCRGKSGLGFKLAELGTVLGRDFPQGGDIVAHFEQFAKLNRLEFQEMTSGKTPEGTVADVAKLNNLSDSHERTLRELVKQVFAEYNIILRSSRYHCDLPTIVTKIKDTYQTDRKIPALIGGVFAVWSLESKTEECDVPFRPHSAQVVAIVRLLALDDQHALQKIRTISGLGYIASVLEGWCKLAGRKSTSDGESRIDSSHLAQIKTGQGKSIVLGTLATVLSIVGFSVDCVCYSAYLSERDQLDFQATFDLFGVSHMVQYGTFSQLSARLVNSEGDVREMTRNLMLSSKKGPGARSRKPSGAKGGQKKRILLIDEVDVFFSPSFYGETYDAVEHLKIPEFTELQKKAWSMRGDTKRILPALEAMDAYHTLMNKFPDVKDILEGQINIMIRDLEAWKNGDSTERFRAYKIMDGKVAYKSGVCYDTKINYNYVTLWTYFHEVECKRVPGAALEDYLGLMIKCGQFSYAEIPKRYNLILGVTGTLVPEGKGGPHPLGTFEQEIIRDDYKITRMTELPSIYGERNLTFRENEHVSVQKDEDSYNNAISLEVAKAVDGRAVLVFFESESKLEAWQDSTYGQRVPVGTMACIKSDTRDITMKVKKATHSGQVTLLSREHGRGLDFNCRDKKVDELGGLHVVQTFLSEELSEEIQIRGRTARQKNKGSFQMILLAKDLGKFEISDDEIEQKEKGLYVRVTCECNICLETFSHGDEIRKLPCNHEFHAKCVDRWLLDGRRTCPCCRANIDASAAAAAATSDVTQQTMYEFLHAKRAVFLDKSSVTRREAVSCAKALHDQSAVFQRELLAFSHAPKQSVKGTCLQFLRGRNILQAKCRLLCLSDATGSMSTVWEKTQNSIRTMLERISAISGGNGNIEVKWLAFRDYELERSKVMEASPWTDDPASLVKFVGSIRCHSGAGCDRPEAVEAALYHANTDPTQSTRVLLIGDAPPHHERKGQKLERLTVHASNLEDGGFVAGGVLSTDYRQECTKLKEKQVKVFSFYLHDDAKASFDEIASMTGGESKKLDCSDAESLVHAVCETALEDIGGSAMQERYRAQYRAT